jgi:hypothetical protein
MIPSKFEGCQRALTHDIKSELYKGFGQFGEPICGRSGNLVWILHLSHLLRIKVYNTPTRDCREAHVAAEVDGGNLLMIVKLFFHDHDGAPTPNINIKRQIETLQKEENGYSAIVAIVIEIR